MLQWLQSKMVLLIAAMILIASVTAVFYHQIREMEEEELEGRVEILTEVIEQISENEMGEGRQRVTFDRENEGLYLSPTVGDESYQIVIYQEYLMIKTEQRTERGRFRSRINPWNPEKLDSTRNISEVQQESNSSESTHLEIDPSRSDLQIVKLELYDGEEVGSHIFVYEVDRE